MTATPLVYLAGASADLETCERYRDRLRAAGLEIARDWMADIRENAARGRPDHEIPADERKAYAESDLRGVYACDVFWLLVPSNASIGAWVEFGWALATRALRQLQAGEWNRRPLIIASGPWRSIFTDLVRREDDHERAFDLILDVARARQA